LNWLGYGGLALAFLTALGTFWYNWRQSKLQVRKVQFSELTETVRLLNLDLVTARADLTATRAEMRLLKLELKTADRRIDELVEENKSLKARVGELELENKALRERAGRDLKN
jgi:chromosome segregation ATPase